MKKTKQKKNKQKKNIQFNEWVKKLSHVKNISMFNSKGDNFIEKHFQTPFAIISCIIPVVVLVPREQGINCKTKLTPMHAQSYLNIRFTKIGFAEITLAKLE